MSTKTVLTLEERVEIAEAAAREMRSMMKSAQGEAELARRSEAFWVRRFGRPAEAAEELLQEAYTRLMVSEGDARYIDNNVDLAVRIEAHLKAARRG
jgi:uncharacterized membrane protein